MIYVLLSQWHPVPPYPAWVELDKPTTSKFCSFQPNRNSNAIESKIVGVTSKLLKDCCQALIVTDINIIYLATYHSPTLYSLLWTQGLEDYFMIIQEYSKNIECCRAGGASAPDTARLVL